MNVLIFDVDCKSSGITYPIRDALNKMGHNAVMFDWKLYFNSKYYPQIINSLKNKVFLKAIEFKLNNDLKNIVNNNKFDLLLVMRGDHIFPETLKFIKTRIGKIVNWNTDDLFNDLNSSNLIKNSIEFYDIHFSPRKSLKNEYLNKGAKAFENLDWYYRYGLDYKDVLDFEFSYSHESTFIGSWSERRQLFISELKNEKVNVYGWGWNKKVNISEYINWNLSPSITIKQMHDEFYRSKININLLTVENRDSSNLRNFEIPSSGGFQLSERSDEILDLFKEDKEIVCFSSSDELKDKYLYYLKNDSLREKIAIAGHKAVFNSNNSLVDRLSQIIYKVQSI